MIYRKIERRFILIKRTCLRQAGLKRIKISVIRYDFRVATKSYLASKIKSETNPHFKVKSSALIS